MQNKAAGSQSTSSSSRMISFEIADCQPYGPHVPISIDDDQYVEYPLDTLVNFPRDLEDEERMLMEAIMESLKDMEVKSSPEESLSSADSKDSELNQESQKLDSPTLEGNCGSPKADSTFCSPTNTDDISSQRSISKTNGSHSVPPCNRASPQDSCSKSYSTSECVQAVGTSALESGDGTKATVTVVKNPSGNVMEGLFRRRDWNFFKSTR